MRGAILSEGEIVRDCGCEATRVERGGSTPFDENGEITNMLPDLGSVTYTITATCDDHADTYPDVPRRVRHLSWWRRVWRVIRRRNY